MDQKVPIFGPDIIISVVSSWAGYEKHGYVTNVFANKTHFVIALEKTRRKILAFTLPVVHLIKLLYNCTTTVIWHLRGKHLGRESPFQKIRR